MDLILKIAAQSVLCLASLSLYVFLIAVVIPTCFMRVVYDTHGNLGRGLKKFVYPDGRAVTYEPHPSIRKYVNKYALFTLDGYKYLQLSIGTGVKSYSASVVVFDNRHKVIDVLDISENMAAASMSSPLRLHEKTSYIALILTEANGKKISNTPYMKMSLRGIIAYFVAVFVATLMEFVHIIAAIKSIYGALESVGSFNVKYSFSFVPAVTVGVLCLAVTLVGRIRKGVKVVLK